LPAYQANGGVSVHPATILVFRGNSSSTAYTVYGREGIMGELSRCATVLRTCFAFWCKALCRFRRWLKKIA
jgi:hypothetical protein